MLWLLMLMFIRVFLVLLLLLAVFLDFNASFKRFTFLVAEYFFILMLTAEALFIFRTLESLPLDGLLFSTKVLEPMIGCLCFI